MSSSPLMPMATAMASRKYYINFKQITFYGVHEVEVQGIADGEVAKGIKAYNPIISGQLSERKLIYHLKIKIDHFK